MKESQPIIRNCPARTVLYVKTVGTPSRTAKAAFASLYGSAYTTKFKVFRPRRRDLKIGGPAAFWPDADRKPKSKWTAIWTLEVPATLRMRDVIQKNPELPVRIKRLKSGLVGEMLHVGPYSRVGPTVKRLLAFIRESGYRISGSHEEAYLSRPGPKAKTLIRYAVSRSKNHRR